MDEIKRLIKDSIAVKEALLESDQELETIRRIADLITDCYRQGGKVILFGNGGSAADAQHLACELMGKFEMQRDALQAVALNTNTSVLTAVGNDYDFESVFSRQVEAWAEPGDVAVGISTSGTSPNVLKALEAARAKGASTVGLTGAKGEKLASAADVCLRVPSTSTPRIQEAHITAGHIICSLVERALFG